MGAIAVPQRPINKNEHRQTHSRSSSLRLIDLTSKELGEVGEQVACQYLKREGYAIHMRNWHAFHGEVDIVASDNGVVVLVEVKTRRLKPQDRWDAPEYAVDSRKRRRYGQLAQDYLRRHSAPYGMRFDIVSVSFDEDDKPNVRHIQSAFECDVL